MRNSLTIDKDRVGRGCPVFIIAEAGVNHNGDLGIALKLVDAAADAGANAVKFQTFKVGQATTRSTRLAGYQSKNIGKNNTLFNEAKGWELKEDYYVPIVERCRKRGIIFFSTPHGGFESVDFLYKLNVPAFKFSSGELTNLPLLAYAAKFNKPMILSTGMATMREVKEAIRTIKTAGNTKIIALHCTTSYPCLLSDVNLLAMRSMMAELDVPVGYSDHTLGDQVPVMAAVLGACVIEKHLTLDRNMPGPDHKASSAPEEFKIMVQKIRDVGAILGSSAKKPASVELGYIPIVRKSVVAGRNIEKGEKFTLENLAIKKPGTGMPPKCFYKIIGCTARRNIAEDLLIKRGHINNKRGRAGRTR